MAAVGKQVRDSFTIASAVMCFMALGINATAATSPVLTPASLTCQGLVNPQGLDAPEPEMNWISVSAEPAARGQVQTAYQILVADSEGALEQNTGNFIIRPIPGGALTNAETQYQSPQGRITSRWTLKDSQFTLDVEVPVNATATIVLPTANTASIIESGLAVASSDGVVFAGIVNGSASYKVGSGHYSFSTKAIAKPTISPSIR